MGAVILEWSAPLNTATRYSVQRRIASSSWSDLPQNTKQIKRDGTTLAQYIDSNPPKTSGIQYRTRSCGILIGGCLYSNPSSSITVSTYNRNTSDSNSNSIRDDAESLADFFHTVGSNNHTYLLHYAYYLQRLVDNSYGPSNDMRYDYWNMSHALICLQGAAGISEVTGTLLDNENAVRRYVSAQNAYSNSSYSVNIGPMTCNISTSTSNMASYVKSELEKSAFFETTQGDNVEKKSENLGLSDDLAVLNATSSSGFKFVIYVNGMLTDRPAADANLAHIKKVFNDYGANVSISLTHNYSEGAFDAIQAFKQYVNSPNDNSGWFLALADVTRFNLGLQTKNIPISFITDYLASIDFSDYKDGDDMTRLYSDINVRIPQGDVVLLAHSQGNFFANEVWEKVNNLNQGKAERFLRIYGLGSPASYIPRN
ncbi:hypothetical protein AX660_11760 [Paraglaciecola hydrolytica]|uniref:Uncharacterized protein n=2 Tax=Paraglaciecola hydrolytica TaxID=1799789 RepID=A0A136A0Y7_9ALTE|nr:hypothetical protein AX660_11760 [Paraglaciecola hydrolytica]